MRGFLLTGEYDKPFAVNLDPCLRLEGMTHSKLMFFPALNWTDSGDQDPTTERMVGADEYLQS